MTMFAVNVFHLSPELIFGLLHLEDLLGRKKRRELLIIFFLDFAILDLALHKSLGYFGIIFVCSIAVFLKFLFYSSRINEKLMPFVLHLRIKIGEFLFLIRVELNLLGYELDLEFPELLAHLLSIFLLGILREYRKAYAHGHKQ